MRWISVLFLLLPLPSQAASCSTESACLAAYAGAVLYRDTSADFKQAGEMLRTGCRAAETGESCRLLGWLIKRNVVPGDETEIWDLNRRACARGDDIGCNFLANALFDPEPGRTIPGRDAAEARAMIEKDCTLGNGFACRKLVRNMAAQDISRYRTECGKGGQVYCALLGGPYLYRATDDMFDPGRAEDIFRKACEAGEGIGCIFLADLISSGQGSDFTETQDPYLIRACTLNVVHGCAVMYEKLKAAGEGKAERAQTFLKSACALGNKRACYEREYFLSTESDAALVRSAELLPELCLAGNAAMCEEAARTLSLVGPELDSEGIDINFDPYIGNYLALARKLKSP